MNKKEKVNMKNKNNNGEHKKDHRSRFHRAQQKNFSLGIIVHSFRLVNETIVASESRQE